MTRKKENHNKMHKMLKTIMLLFVVSVLFTACSRVPSGNVGIKFYLLGGDKGVDTEVLTPGRYHIGINEELFLFPTFTQNYVWTKGTAEGSQNDESIIFQTKEGLTVSTDVGITYHLDVPKVPNIFQKYKKGIGEITDLFLRNMVRDAFVTASSTKEVETVYGEGKAELIDEVEAMVKAQTDSLGIIVDKIYLIGSMRLPASVVTAIDDKIKATQEAKKMENEVQKTIAQALKKVEASRGDSLSSVITAAGQAQANRLLNASITPSLLKFKEIEMYENTWDGKVSQVAGGAGVLLNLGK